MNKNKSVLIMPVFFMLLLLAGYIAIFHYTVGTCGAMFDINGTLAKAMQIKNQHSSSGLYLSKDGYIDTKMPQTSTDYEVEQVIGLRDFLQEHDIDLVYVNKPVKYLEDEKFTNEFGVKSFSNQNADIFLASIREAGVNCIDLRENIKNENIDIRSMFYRTDHHWTTFAGLWASEKIAKHLNETIGYHIDESIYQMDNFEVMTLPNMWIGEQGRKFSKRYVGLEDYSYIFPKKQVALSFEQGNVESDFMYFIADLAESNMKMPYTSDTMHYSYKFIGAHNEQVKAGKVLVVGDSYDNVVVPFLSLGIRDIDFVELRYRNENADLRKFILDNEFDTVIISYAQFMIGAHDDDSSDNYRMFDFE